MYENQVYAWEDAIEAGEMDPEDIDVRELVYDDETHLTPKLEELLSEDQREEFARLQREKIDQRAEEREKERREEFVRQHSDALDRLRDPTQERTRTAELLTGTNVEVRVHTNGRIDRALVRMDKAESAWDVTDDIIEVICWFVVDEELSRPEVWEAYAEEYGAPDLMREAMRIMEPYFDDVDDDPVIQRFRGE